MHYDTILYAVEQGVATLTLNRPENLNAFNKQMIAETIQAFKTAARDSEVRCVLLTGSGRGFSSGQDLVEAAELMHQNDGMSTGEHLRTSYHVLIRRILSTEKPILGVLNGIAAGIGMSIALATDIRIASNKAAFALGFSQIGLIPDGGANWFLTRLIGYPRAYEMALTGEKLAAQQAFEWGMINRVVPHEQLMEVATAYAQKLASGPTRAFGLTKRAMLKGMFQSLEDNLNYEAYLQDIAGSSADCREGIAAFIEKRPPNFQGK